VHRRGERGKPICGLGGYQMFDSLGVEASGNICVATLIKGAITVIAPEGSLLNARPPAAVAAGNVATPPRVADPVLAAIGHALGQGKMKHLPDGNPDRPGRGARVSRGVLTNQACVVPEFEAGTGASPAGGATLL